MLAVGLSSLEHTQNVFSMLEKADVVWKGAVFTIVELQPLASSADTLMITRLQMAQTREASSFLLANCLPLTERSVANGGFHKKATIAFFPNRLLVYLGL